VPHVAAEVPQGPDVFALAAVELAVSLPLAPVAEPTPVAVVPAPRPGAVRIVTLPVHRVSATDLVAAAA
jgi:hypothetical protein